MRTVHVLLARPRGFCAGVERSIGSVRAALVAHGAPVYVRHEIVHNRSVVQELEAEGAIFVEDLKDVPGDRPVILSAHGVPKSVLAEVRERRMMAYDSVCPLITKVHVEVGQFHAWGYEIILIGEAGHQEIVGTLGQLPPGIIHLVQNEEEARSVQPRQSERIAYLTQTTLAIEETLPIIAILRERFPTIREPKKEDICYATTNRQNAVKAMIQQGAEVVIVVGARNSANSNKMVDVARMHGCERSFLVPTVADVPWEKIGEPHIVGISSGASAPERLVQEVLDALRRRYQIKVTHVNVAEEHYSFKLPGLIPA